MGKKVGEKKLGKMRGMCVGVGGGLKKKTWKNLTGEDRLERRRRVRGKNRWEDQNGQREKK